jgi:ABC-type nickel/cobalt efflux system permease component RcnA
MSEAQEHAEHAEHAAHSNRKIALAIAIIALFLAFSETLGKSAQTEAISLNIKVSDTWNFFQAKTIRQTSIRTAAEGATVQLPLVANDAVKGEMSKQIDAWKSTVARYESDPKEKDGRKELREQAEQLEHERDTLLARYHNYELASAAFQIGIVLCSAAVITGMIVLAWLAGGIGVLGAIFMALGLFAPHALHLG